MDDLVGKGIFFSAVDVNGVGGTILYIMKNNIDQSSNTQYDDYDRETQCDQCMAAILGWTAEKKVIRKKKGLFCQDDDGATHSEY